MRNLLLSSLKTIAVALLLLCSHSGFSSFAQDKPSPAYNQVYGIATHNSYWINRSDQVDYFASGTQELLTDQLLHEHVRAIEIDIHSEGEPGAGRWRVYHTSDSEDFSCRYLDDCIEYLRTFQYAVPDHDVVNIVIELKNVVPTGGTYDVPSASVQWTHPNFNADHTIEQFDDTFRRLLGGSLYTPRDFLARCPEAKSMVECARTKGWPSIDQLRGKFIVNILGSWSSAASDWVQYASSDLSNRVAFPMQSVFLTSNGACPDPTGNVVTGGKSFAAKNFTVNLDGGLKCIEDIDGRGNPPPPMKLFDRRAAFDASVFWTLEDFWSPLSSETAKAFLKRGGVIRGHDSFAQDEQKSQLGVGVQMVMTDYPWNVIDDGGPPGSGIPTDPSHRLRDSAWANPTRAIPPAVTPYREIGNRFYAHSKFPTQIWAYETVPAVSQRWWETMISTTRRGDTWAANTHDGIILDDVFLSYGRRAQDYGEGSIRVSSEDGADWIVFGRQKNTTPGASYFQETVDLYVHGEANGKPIKLQFTAPRYGPCKRDQDPHSDNVSSKCIGSLIAVSVGNQQDGSVVKLFSAGLIGSDGTPLWQELGQWNFSRSLTRQGFSSFGDVLFAGPRRAVKLRPDGLPQGPAGALELSSLPGRQVFAGSVDDARIVDLSSATTIFNADFDQDTIGAPPTSSPAGPPLGDSIRLLSEQSGGNSMLVTGPGKGFNTNSLRITLVSHFDPSKNSGVGGHAQFFGSVDPTRGPYNSGRYHVTWRSLSEKPFQGFGFATVTNVEHHPAFTVNYSNGVLFFQDRTGVINTKIPYRANVSQRFDAVIDLNAKTFDLSIDGVQVGLGRPFQDPMFEQVHYFFWEIGGWNSEEYAIDDIRITYEP